MEEEYLRNEVEMAKLLLQERVNEMETLRDINDMALRQEAELLKRLEMVQPGPGTSRELKELEAVERTVEGLEEDLDDLERMIARLESEAHQ